MTRKETITILTLLSQTYENFEKRMDTDEKVESMIMLWTECLGDLDYNLVLQAVKKTIIESPYLPTIHEIRKNAIEMVKPNTSKTAIEAWNEAYSMICNGLYMTEEQFEMASPEVKKFFGNVRQVKELAQTDSDTINTVTKGQFLKQYETIIEREKQDKLLPEKMQNLIKGLTSKMEIKQIGE
jgi:hypothetical protein